MAALAVLGTLLLSLGQENSFIPLVALVAAVVSLLVTDLHGLFRLPRIFANLCAVTAAVWVLLDFFGRARGHGQLLSIANLLILLQVVLLFQEKTQRIYWQLLVLSVLQVVVASALSSGFQFGFLMILYVLLALSGLALFFIHRESERVALQHRLPFGSQPLFVGPTRTRLVTRSESSLSGYAEEFSKGRLVQQWITIGFGGMAIAMVVFYLTPRSGSSPFASRGQSITTVGFHNGIALGELGTILESDEVVMRVAYIDPETGESATLVGQPYLRGAVLPIYQPKDNDNTGAWKPSAFRSQEGNELAPRIEPDVPYLEQQILLEPLESDILFTATPAMRIRDDEEKIYKGRRSSQYYRIIESAAIEKQPFRYRLAVIGFQNGWQLPLVPNNEYDPSSYEARVFDYERFAALKELADRILADRNLENAGTLDKAKALTSYFRDSSEYSYTLDFRDIERDESIDPIVDFTINFKTGHCQYYASALAMMLRSQGIPARLVVGFKPLEYNAMGGFYLVRQRDAHAWVEAFIESPEVVPDLMAQDPEPFQDAWMRLDPTTANLRPALPEESKLGSMVDETMGYMQFLWEDYVEGFSQTQQKRSIYESWDSANSGSGIAGFFTSLGLDVWNYGQRSWFSWKGFLASVLFCISTVTSVRLFSWAQPRWREWLAKRRTEIEHRTPTIAFYQRLDRILARHGFIREDHETQREFTAKVALAWPLAKKNAVTSALDEIVTAFYRVRFGLAVLTATELAELESAFTLLESQTTASNDGISKM